MQDNTPIISARQLFFILFLSRMFSLISYTPDSGSSSDFAMTVLSLVVSMILTVVAAVPFFILVKNDRTKTIIDIAIDCSPKIGYILAGTLCGFFIIISADTISNFEFFLSSTAMPNASSFLICITMGAGIIYAARTGLEAIARMSTLVTVITAISFVVIIFAVIEHFNPLYLRPQLSGTFSDFFEMVRRNFSQNLELVALLMLSQNTVGSIKKKFVTWNVAVNVTMIITALAIFIIFGDKFIFTKPLCTQNHFRYRHFFR